MAQWIETDDVGEPAPFVPGSPAYYLLIDALQESEDECVEWEARHSFSARLFALGLGLLVGIVLAHWAAGIGAWLA